MKQKGNAQSTVNNNRKTRSDKKVPVLPKLDQNTHKKLKRLALACDISKTQLAAECIELCLSHADVVNWFQEKYDANEFRIIPVRQMDGTIEY